jgi:pyridoxamine 5'-phosphate oxidase
MAPDPIALFRDCLERAQRAGGADPTAVALATASEGRPSVRYVLLKGVDGRGFVFYTNYNSRKAGELAANPRAALAFHWPTIGTEVRAQGPVTRAGAEESDAYFDTRARWSQLGAWASRQSAPLPTRALLIARWLAWAVFFFGRRVRRPPFWGGFRLAPERIEFLRDVGEGRIERSLFVRKGGEWIE